MTSRDYRTHRVAAVLVVVCVAVLLVMACSSEDQSKTAKERPSSTTEDGAAPPEIEQVIAEPSGTEVGDDSEASGSERTVSVGDDENGEQEPGTKRSSHSEPTADVFADHWVSRDRDEMRIPKEGESAFVIGPWEGELWTDLREEPKNRSQRLAQMVLGDLVEIEEQRGGWSRVSYARIDGWVRSKHLSVGSEEFHRARRKPELRVVARAPGIKIDSGGLLPFGCVLPVGEASDGDGIELLLPDGRSVEVAVTNVSSVQTPPPVSDVLQRTKGFRGIRFQSGSNTIDAMDSAGLIHMVFRVAGRDLPRSVQKLQETGEEIAIEEAVTGDVVFFSTFYEDQRRPVILLDEGETFIEASPSSGVAIGVMEQMRNREIMEVRRYIDAPEDEDLPVESGSWWSWLPWVD